MTTIARLGRQALPPPTAIPHGISAGCGVRSASPPQLSAARRAAPSRKPLQPSHRRVPGRCPVRASRFDCFLTLLFGPVRRHHASEGKLTVAADEKQPAIGHCLKGHPPPVGTASPDRALSTGRQPRCGAQPAIPRAKKSRCRRWQTGKLTSTWRSKLPATRHESLLEGPNVPIAGIPSQHWCCTGVIREHTVGQNRARGCAVCGVDNGRPATVSRNREWTSMDRRRRRGSFGHRPNRIGRSDQAASVRHRAMRPETAVSARIHPCLRRGTVAG